MSPPGQGNTALVGGDIKRRLRLIQDLPGADLRAVLLPSEGGASNSQASAGGSRLEVDAERTKAFTIYGNLNNRGSPRLGPGSMTVTATSEDIFSFGEQITLTFAGTPDIDDWRAKEFSEQIYGSIETRMPVPFIYDGLELYTMQGLGEVQPKHDLQDLEIHTRMREMRYGLSYPLYRRKDNTVTIDGSFVHRSLKTKFDDVPTYKEFSQYLDLHLIYDRVNSQPVRSPISVPNGDFRYRTLIDLGMQQSLPWGVTSVSRKIPEFALRNDANPRATRLSLYFSHLQNLQPAVLQRELPWASRWSVLLQATGQYAFNPLLAQDEFSAGGYPFGRAYDFGEIIGDTGGGVSAELRLDLDLGSDLDFILNDPIQLYGFYDVAAAWQRNTRIGSKATIASVGAGLRLPIGDMLKLELEWAEPQTRLPFSDENDLGGNLIFNLDFSIEF